MKMRPSARAMSARTRRADGARNAIHTCTARRPPPLALANLLGPSLLVDVTVEQRSNRMHAKRAFAVIYMIPGAAALLYWLARHPAPSEAASIAAAVFGGLIMLLCAAVIVFPLTLRRLGAVARADRVQRAAVAGSGLPVFMTFLWSILFLPVDPKPRVILGLSGAALTLVATLFISRRWPNLGRFG